MIWHPLLLGVLLVDTLALVLSLYAAGAHVRALLHWSPGSADRRQIALEGAVDGAALATHHAVTLFVAGSLILVVAISSVLPALIPGAMCGTGVIEATRGEGGRALLLRGVALSALWVWCTLTRVQRTHPLHQATRTAARWQLLTLPLLALTLLYTLRAVLQLDPHRPVSCCQAVHDNFRSLGEATTSAGLSDGSWLWLAGGGALLLIGLAIHGLRGQGRSPASVGLPFVALVWVPVAGHTLVRVLAAYHYEVLHHHCPWCLFLPEHRAVGYLLFGALVLVGLEAIAILTATRLARAHPPLRESAHGIERRALQRLLIAMGVFGALTVGPMLHWRLSHGVWLHGG